MKIQITTAIGTGEEHITWVAIVDYNGLRRSFAAGTEKEVVQAAIDWINTVVLPNCT